MCWIVTCSSICLRSTETDKRISIKEWSCAVHSLRFIRVNVQPVIKKKKKKQQLSVRECYNSRIYELRRNQWTHRGLTASYLALQPTEKWVKGEWRHLLLSEEKSEKWLLGRKKPRVISSRTDQLLICHWREQMKSNRMLKISGLKPGWFFGLKFVCCSLQAISGRVHLGQWEKLPEQCQWVRLYFGGQLGSSNSFDPPRRCIW